eukprot:3950569-Karenia_brevis.AAC.1
MALCQQFSSMVDSGRLLIDRLATPWCALCTEYRTLEKLLDHTQEFMKTMIPADVMQVSAVHVYVDGSGVNEHNVTAAWGFAAFL